MMREQEGKIYTTPHYTKFHTALMHMYQNAKIKIPEYFISELSQFMSGMRRIIAKYTQNTF